LRLPFESVRTVYEGTSEVRVYRNEVTEVLQIGKRVSRLGAEEAIPFEEAKLLQTIRHAHVVPVYDVAVVEDAPDLHSLMEVIEMIMPYYTSGSLFDALQKGVRFTIGEAIRLTRQTLLGLAELHDVHSILHRDVKSGNVFLDDDGKARVGDLGLAVRMDDAGSAEPYATTQLFTPPEAHSDRRVTRASDIYGVGLILLELVNGPFPYKGYDRGTIHDRLQDGKLPIFPRHLRPDLRMPPRLRRIINKATVVDPRKRFQSSHEMIDALDRTPFVDWQPATGEDDGWMVWSGRSSVYPELAYRVEARSMKRGQPWKLSARRKKTAWRRVLDDQRVDDLDGTQARAFFDQVVADATSR
ncbi:MAG: serine/threonine-protein kinase, partial [Sandaracinaceae bacterium]